MTKAKQEIIILGAGLAGLSAAYHLQKKGFTAQIFEKAASIGGLCRSRHINGFTFDYTGHLLYFKNRDIFRLVQGLTANNLSIHRRNSWIFSKDAYTRYPFQANTYGLPPQIIRDCLLGLIAAQTQAGKRRGQDKEKKKGLKTAKNFEDWILQTFGRGIARHFMLPYNQKFWTLAPCKLTCEWLDGYIPIPTLAETLTGAISDYTKPFGYNQEFWYPLKGGIEQLPLAFQKSVKEVQIKTAQEAVRIDTKSKRIDFQCGGSIYFDKLLSTIPLIEIAKLLKDIPKDVVAAVNKLRYTSIFNLNLGIDRPCIGDKHWVYFPEKEFVFYRVGFPHNFSSNLAPEGKSSLYIEVSYSKGKPIDKRYIVKRIIKDLTKAKIILKDDKIIAQDVNDIKYGYIIYDENYRQSTAAVLNFLAKNQIYCFGRYGRWKYLSMEQVISESKDLAENICGKKLRVL